MDRAQLYKLTELIVAEVVRRIAQEERRRQNEEWHRQRREREKQWEEQRKAQAEQNRARNQAQPVTPRKATAAEMTSLVKMEKKGNVSGTLCTVFGLSLIHI